MRPADVRAQIKAGTTSPLYLLEGDDPQSRADLAAEFASLVDEGLHAFNVQSFHAGESGSASARDQMIGDLLSAARTLPMMAPRRVVVVHAAERLLSPRKAADQDSESTPVISAKRKKAATPVDDLEQYLAAPEPLTTMVLVAGALDANRRLVKLARTHAVNVDCGTLENAGEAARWVKARLADDKLTIEPHAATLLLQATGLHLSRIRAEVDKLALFAAGEPVITSRHVKEMVLPQLEPGEEFALGKAMWNDNAKAALREVDALLSDGMVPVMVLGQIRAAASRFRDDARARAALDKVFETDLAIKSSAGEPKHLLEKLVIELCPPSRR